MNFESPFYLLLLLLLFLLFIRRASLVSVPSLEIWNKIAIKQRYYFLTPFIWICIPILLIFVLSGWHLLEHHYDYCVILDRYNNKNEVNNILTHYPNARIITISPTLENDFSFATPHEAWNFATQTTNSEQFVIISDGIHPDWEKILPELKNRHGNFYSLASPDIFLQLSYLAREEDGQIECLVTIINRTDAPQKITLCSQMGESQTIQRHTISFNKQHIQQLFFPPVLEQTFLTIWTEKNKKNSNTIKYNIPARKRANILIIAEHTDIYLLSALQIYNAWINMEHCSILPTMPKNHNADLVIYCLPEYKGILKQGHYLFLGTKLDHAIENHNLIAYDWNKTHPISHNLPFMNFEIETAYSYKHTINNNQIILQGKDMPLIWETENNQAHCIITSFKPLSWQYTISFPLFIQNTILWSLNQKQSLEIFPTADEFLPSKTMHSFTSEYNGFLQPKKYDEILLYVALILSVLFVFARVHLLPGKSQGYFNSLYKNYNY